MFLTLIKNPIISAVLTALIAFALHTADVWYLKIDYEHQLITQKEQLQQKCENDKKITTEVSHEYQGKITALNSRIAELKRMRPSICVPITGSTAGHSGTTTAAESSGPNGVDAGALLDFAGEAEKYRLQLIGCQDFLKKISQP